MDFYFEKHKSLRFEMLDDDGNRTSDTIGFVETTLGHIAGS
jgi:hypothetical protein